MSSSKRAKTTDNNTPKRICVRLSAQSIYLMIQNNMNPLDLSNIWLRATHIVFDGLVFTAQGEIEIGCAHKNSGSETVLYNPDTYLPWIRALKRRYKHLKIIWALPPSASPKIPLDMVIATCGWQVFFANIKKLLDLNLPADGIEFNFTLSPIINEEFMNELMNLSSTTKCWVCLPNSIPILKTFQRQQFLASLYETCDALVVNSYGFMKHRCKTTNHGTLKVMQAINESSLHDLRLVEEYLLTQIPDTAKLLMGLDTLGVEYKTKTESLDVEKFRMIPTTKINNLLINGYAEDPKAKRVYKYKTSYDSRTQSSLMYLDRYNKVISYDNFLVKNAKLNHILSENWLGVIIGDIRFDQEHTHRQSLLQLSYNKLKPNGLEQAKEDV